MSRHRLGEGNSNAAANGKISSQLTACAEVGSGSQADLRNDAGATARRTLSVRSVPWSRATPIKLISRRA